MSELARKVFLVIDSCYTMDQLISARRYLGFASRYLKITETSGLLEVLKANKQKIRSNTELNHFIQHNLTR